MPDTRTICSYCGTWRSRPCGEGCYWDITETKAGFERTPNLRNDLVDAGRRALNYIENTESELGITLECGDALRAVLAKVGQMDPQQGISYLPKGNKT